MKYFSLFVLLCVVVAVTLAQDDASSGEGEVTAASAPAVQGKEMPEKKRGRGSKRERPAGAPSQEARDKRRGEQGRMKGGKGKRGKGNQGAAAADPAAPAPASAPAPAPEVAAPAAA